MSKSTNPLETTVENFYGLRSFRHRIPDLAVGVEIEAEGLHLPEINSDIWNTVPEGSLRNGGMEYIFKRPLDIQDLNTAFKEWDSATVFTVFNDSLRTSVHIHYNVRRFLIQELFNIIAAYWFLENPLVQLNGNTRVGNLFCLRVKDAEYTSQSIIQDIKRERFLHEITSVELRYSALNLAALKKFGSIEFRFLKGYHESSVIKEWVLALHQMVSVAAKAPSPRAILSMYRNTSTSEFLRAFFPEAFVTKILGLGIDEVSRMLSENEVYVERLVSALETKTKYKRWKIEEDIPGNPVVETPVLTEYPVWTLPEEEEPLDEEWVEEEFFEDESP